MPWKASLERQGWKETSGNKFNFASPGISRAPSHDRRAGRRENSLVLLRRAHDLDMLRTGLSVVVEAPATSALRIGARSARLAPATAPPTPRGTSTALRSVPRIRCVHSSAAARAAAAKAEAAPESSEPRKWTPLSVRTGVIARKKGMTTIFNEHGVACPVTVLQVCRKCLKYRAYITDACPSSSPLANPPS